MIYDTPDVNLGFDGLLSIYDTANHSDLDKKIFSNDNTDPNGTYTSSQVTANGTKIKAYDVYFVTKEPLAQNQAGVSAWTEKTLEFYRDDVENKVLQSMDKATVPKEVLFKKPLGAKLTAEEEKKIEEAGGLNKKVGKGFKITLSDYKSAYVNKGGYLTFVYRLSIKNPSPELNADNNPIYKNYATYYAQKIPNCKPRDEHCTSIQSEKTKMTDSGSPDNPIKGEVKLGTIGAEMIIPATGFTKVEADQNGNPLKDRPLAGATFTIYKSDAQGAKGQMATDRDGTALEGLVTNQDGKLTKEGKALSLNLNKGYYLVSETAAPEGYDILKQDSLVAVGYKAQSILVANKKKTPPATDPKPVTLEGEKAFAVFKKVVGKDATENFTFCLAADPANPAGCDMVAPQTNSTVNGIKDGTSQKVAFDAITFTKEGSFRFTVNEVAGEAPGWAYDQTQKTLTVLVQKNGAGNLEAVVTGNEPTFTNTYTETSLERPNPDKPTPETPNPAKTNVEKPAPEAPQQRTTGGSTKSEAALPKTGDDAGIAGAMALFGLGSLVLVAARRTKRPQQ
ncbi:Spy0128 family protein [Olsenella sp. HMSC062G07]|uniref:Spy0128 family protein n=1 Tax=Olsenella sp. HMSC062G07 TaxID=1739330 RepID=UPI0008A2F0D3|nr:FctA domain-containing protein [Olsenella sp. HMSC062G07]OFK23985.1 hypothetical protein HMPREF2826_08560 [Olsenella sp. HMSC062G07]